MIVVARTQTTLQLTGGKIYVMSLETFQAVSIFWFLLQMEIVSRYEGYNKDWVHLAQDGDQWRSLMKTVMNILVC
jgi:hypothetical protein